jgi:hypothetical protein
VTRCEASHLSESRFGIRPVMPVSHFCHTTVKQNLAAQGWLGVHHVGPPVFLFTWKA